MAELKPTRHLLALCREMFERRAKYGANYPPYWRIASRKKLLKAGFAEDTGNGEFYFTESGLNWYLSNSKK